MMKSSGKKCSSLLAQKSQPYGTANRGYKELPLVEQAMQRLMLNDAQGT